MQSEKHISGHTKDLSMFGCFAMTVDSFPEGTKVRLTISRGETHLVAQGRVTYSRLRSGMGISFTAIEPSSVSVLDVWLAGLRK
jgi:PilZ domain